MIRTYSELITLPTFRERFEYLRLHGKVGIDTFGYDRIFNQIFYKSTEWRALRNRIITRDGGCDLGIEECEIPDGLTIIIHHMNPISLDDIAHSTEYLMNPEYLITTVHRTHNSIHYGDFNSVIESYQPIVRSKNDTCPWKKF